MISSLEGQTESIMVEEGRKKLLNIGKAWDEVEKERWSKLRQRAISRERKK